MGKKRIASKGEKGTKGEDKKRSASKLSRKKLENGILHVQATFNNTKLILTERNGDAVVWSSTGSLGFKGAKKGTPFAAAQVGDVVGEKSKVLGLKKFDIIVNGVGASRESAIRSFMAKSGAAISSIKDTTPTPHNGPRPRKPRRV